MMTIKTFVAIVIATFISSSAVYAAEATIDLGEIAERDEPKQPVKDQPEKKETPKSAPAPKEKAEPRPQGSQDTPFRWKKVGEDPCNPKAGCTLEWALTKSEWPPEVQNAFKEEIQNTPPLQTKVCTGWEGWMTWGKHKRKFRDEVVAEWGVGHCEFAAIWTTQRAAVEYHVIRVDECRNWGGWTESIEQIEKPTGPKAEKPIRLGETPMVHCPDEQPGCTPCTGRS